MFNNKKETSSPAKMMADGKVSETAIGNGARITGDMETIGSIRIDGKITGNVTSEARVVIGASGYLEGNLRAESSIIDGKIKGTVSIQNLLTLKTTAVIDGDIVCNKLVIENGATFNGTCKMGENIGKITLGDPTEQTV